MQTYTRSSRDLRDAELEVRVNGPDCEPLPAADVRRLFPGGSLTEARLDRLQTWPRITVQCGDQIVAVATCQKTDTELRVAEVGLEMYCGCNIQEVLGALLDAVELAGLAGGCRRVVVMPPKAALGVFERRGYATISERCAGGWLEKPLM
jgi:hypothetical protein